MDQEMQDLIDHFEIVCRRYLNLRSTTDSKYTLVHAEDLLEVFAAFRLEIIKAGGRNA